MRINELHNQPVKPDTYEASMAQNQLLKIGTHSVRLHGLIKDEQEMESWVAKKIDLASNYVKSVHGYMAGSKAGAYDDNGMTENKINETYVRVKKDAEGEISQYAGRLGRVVDQDDDGDYLVSWGDNEGEDWIEKKNLEFLPDDAYWNPDDEDEYAKGTDGEVATLDPEFEESKPNADAERADAARGMWASSKEIQSRFKTWQDFMNSEDFDEWLDDKFRDELGEDAGEKIANMAQNMSKDEFMSHADELGLTPEEAAEYYKKMQGGAYASKFEDANNLETAYKQIAMLANTVKKEPTDADDQMDVADDVARPITKILSTIMDYTKGEQMPDGSASKTTYVDMYKKLGMLANKGAQTNDPKVAPLLFKMMSSIYDMDKVSEGSIQEDAGEGHMSKSQLYQTAKMSIELIEMINAGDDLEAWVQTKLNLAADYLQGVYHYEEYQKLNPYREQIDSNTFAKHSEIVKKNIDEILSKETKIDDIDTKPGMLKILGKRVNEVEKEMAKENRKANEEAAGVGIITKQNTTADVKPGDEYKNVKKLGLKAGAYESKLTDMLNQRLK